MRKLVLVFLLFCSLSSSGCASAELSTVLKWSKADVGIGARTVQQVEQILWQAQQNLYTFNPTPIWSDYVEPATLDKMEVIDRRQESLFMSTWWVSPDQTLPLGTSLYGRLSFAISTSKPDLGDELTAVAEGDIRVEAIFAGIYDDSVFEKTYVEDLATTMVNIVVERMNEILSMTAEDAGAFATVLSYSGD